MGNLLRTASLSVQPEPVQVEIREKRFGVIISMGLRAGGGVMMLCWLPGAITAFGDDYLSLVPNTLILYNVLVKISSAGNRPAPCLLWQIWIG